MELTIRGDGVGCVVCLKVAWKPVQAFMRALVSFIFLVVALYSALVAAGWSL